METGTELLFGNITQTPLPNVSASATTATTIVASATIPTGKTALTVVVPTFVNPARLTISLTNPVIVGDTAVIRITGTCLDGSGEIATTTVTEEIPFETGITGNTIVSDVYFYTVTAVEVEGWTSGDISITGFDESRTVTFNCQDDKLIRFLILEAAKGIVLNTYSGVISTGLSFTFNRGSAIVYDVGFTGRRAQLYRDLQGRIGGAAAKTSAANVGLATTEVFTGWQCELTLNGTPAAITEATFGMAQNLEPTGAISRRRWEEVKPFRQTRNVTADMTVIYAPENDYARIFRNNFTMANCRITLLHRPFGGFPWKTSFILPQAQVANNPDAEAGEGLLTQNVRVKSFTSDIGLATPDDIRIECDYSKYRQLREFTV